MDRAAVQLAGKYHLRGNKTLRGSAPLGGTPPEFMILPPSRSLCAFSGRVSKHPLPGAACFFGQGAWASWPSSFGVFPGQDESKAFFVLDRGGFNFPIAVFLAVFVGHDVGSLRVECEC